MTGMLDWDRSLDRIFGGKSGSDIAISLHGRIGCALSGIERISTMTGRRCG